MLVKDPAQRAAPLASLRRLVFWMSVLAVLATPVFLVASNVTWAFNFPGLYTYGFQKYEIAPQMVMPPEELERIAAEIRAYWNNDAGLLDARYAGRPFFNQREVSHLRDVKGLVRGVAAWRWVTLGYLLAFVAAGAAWCAMTRDHRALTRAAAWGGGLTLALVAACGVVFLAAFDWIFLLFHRLSFANDFWQLTCPGDNLVCLFPEGFWFDAAMLIVLATVVEAAMLLALGLAVRRLLRRAGRATPRSTSPGNPAA